MTEDQPLLLQPTRLYSRAEVLARDCPIPATPGIYAWWFANTLSVPEPEGCVEKDGKRLLYVGVSPRSQAAAEGANPQVLRSRIRYHYDGKADGSTLRLSLGCLLGLQLRRVGNGKRHTFAAQEKLISEWMGKNAFVSWIEVDHPWEIEEELVSLISLPLVLDQNSAHPFHAELTEMRMKAKRQANKLPIVAAPAPGK